MAKHARTKISMRFFSLLLCFLFTLNAAVTVFAAGDTNPVTVYVDKAAHGSVSIQDETITATDDLSDAYMISSGQITLVVTPDSGYRLKELEILDITHIQNPVAIEADAGYTFAIPDGCTKIEIMPEFEEGEAVTVRYNVNVSFRDTDTGGKATGCSIAADKTNAVAGELVTITSDMAPGTKFGPNGLIAYKTGDDTTAVSLTAAGADSYTFSMPAFDVSVFADFTFDSFEVAVAAFDHSDVTDVRINENAYTGPVSAQPGDTIRVDLYFQSVLAQGAQALNYSYTENGNPVIKTVPLTQSGSGAHYVGSFTMPAGDVTIYVVTGTAYHIFGTGESGIGEFGNINADKTMAMEGELIHVSATPREPSKYSMIEWHITWLDGETQREIEVTEDEDDPMKGSFIMPAADVTIAADFLWPFDYIERNSDGNIYSAEYNIRTRYEFIDLGTTTMSGWYVHTGELTLDNRLEVVGDTWLILTQGSTLNAKMGIYIRQGCTLTIYGQTDGEDTGTIRASASNGAGIGGITDAVGGNLVVHGGRIYANGSTNAAGIGGGNHNSGFGDVTIYGGTVEATGGSSGAGIGKGQQNTTFGSLTVYGGTVTAKSKTRGAGIGGGEDCGGFDVTVWDGTVYAECLSEFGAGIGGGEEGDQNGVVTIHGGTVTAKGGTWAAGIGGGEKHNGGDVTIDGGSVFAYGGSSGAGIGGGKYGHQAGTVTVSGGTVYAEGGTYAAGVGGGWYGNNNEVVISGGKVTAKGGKFGAGIGGGFGWNINSSGGPHDGKCGTVTISGGVVNATGGTAAAGIGAGVDGKGGEINVSGGTVTCIAGSEVGFSDTYYEEYSGPVYAVGRSLDSSFGTVTLADAVCVKADGTLVNREKRICILPDFHNKVVFAPCEHENGLTALYIDDQHHQGNCKNCYYAPEAQAHEFDADGVCSVCGFDRMREPFGLTFSYALPSYNISDLQYYSVGRGCSYIMPGLPVLAFDIPYICAGWKAEGSDALLQPGDTVTVSADTTYRAQFDEACYIEFVIPVEGASMAAVKVVKGEDFRLPGCEFAEEGKTFVGWSAGGSDEILLANRTIPVQEDAVLTAVYTTFYPVDLADGIKNGSVTMEPDFAREGDEVTLTVTPDEGFALVSLTYTPDGGEAVEIPETDGVYSFTMPAGNVTVSAAFVPLLVLHSGDNDVIFVKGENIEYTFTPEVTQGYRIYSVGSLDPRCSLYDEETLLDYSDDADGRNFSVARILTAGKTYRLVFGCYSDGGTATVNVEPIELYPFRVDPALKENTAFLFDHVHASYLDDDRDLPEGTQIELYMSYIPDSNFDHWLITWPGAEEPEAIETFQYKFKMPAGPVYVSAVYTPPTELHMGENTVTLKQLNRTGYYFTPPESGWYRFKDLDEQYDTTLTVYLDGNELLRSDSPYGGKTDNFDGVVELEAGVRYNVVMLSYYQTVEIPVSVTRADVFPISASAGENGRLLIYDRTVDAGVSEAHAGNEMRIQAEPADGYMVESISVLDAEGNEIPTEMAYFRTFIMPESAVSVTATFAPIDKTATVEESVYDVIRFCGVHNGDHWVQSTGAHPGDRVYAYASPSNNAATVCEVFPEVGESFTVDGNFDFYMGAWIYSFIMPDCDVLIRFTPLDGHAVMIGQTEGGAVTADKALADTDETVTLTVTPETGYFAGPVSVKHGVYDVEFTDLGNGQYSFQMPYRHVIVSATFIPCGHEVAELSGWTWADGKATASFACEACGETITVTDDAPAMTEVTPATCTADQTATYAATVTFNGTEYTETSEVTAVPGTKTGHSYGDPVWAWSADHKTVTATFTCEKGDDTKTVTQNATQVEVSAATATADQVVKYTVSVTFDGKTYNTETGNITVPGTATGEPGQSDPPSQPSNPSGSGKCKWCGETHSGFWGSIVGFWHTIFYFWAHLFGLR